MAKFSVLLSCMFENESILLCSNIKSDVIVVNQCNYENIITWVKGDNKIVWVNTKERGLARSRNLALSVSEAEFCMLADNDEFFVDGLEEKVLNAYKELPEADVIIFKLYNKNKKLRNIIYKLSRFELLRVSSCQISFKRDSLIKNKIKFDINLGSGTGNGAGEETKFLLDCYNKKLNIFYYPMSIASMRQRKSVWFKGFDRCYFYNRGMSTRYILGLFASIFYAIYFLISKYNLYKEHISFTTATYMLLKGIAQNKLKTRKSI